jgi:hypothetical protein
MRGTEWRRGVALAEYQAELLSGLLLTALVPTVESAPEYAGGHFQELIEVPNGSPAVYTVAGVNALWPLSVLCRLTCTAAVADRTVALEYQRPNGGRYLVAGTQAAVQASGVQSFCWHPQAGEVAWPVEDAAIAPLPQQHVYPGFRLALVIGNAQAGDLIDQAVISARFDSLHGG